MTHVKALEAGQSSQGTSESITPEPINIFVYKLWHINGILFDGR